MRILFLTHHWHSNSHHSIHSGYQELVRYFEEDHECAVVTCGKKNEIVVEGNIFVHYVKPLMKKDILFSKRLSISRYAQKIQADFDVVHALYSDCGRYQEHPNFFSTFHISRRVVANVGIKSYLFLILKYLFIERHVFKKSKKVFIVSNNLRNSLGKFALKGVYLPHGINTEYWNPKTPLVNIEDTFPKNYVLCVGNNGVDKKTLADAIRKYGDCFFVLVGIKNMSFSGLTNFVSLHGVSEETLRAIYARARLFIRPMTFATANNSILEAMSMNKSILISTPDGIYDYFKDNDFLKITSTSDFLHELGRALESDKKLTRANGTDNSVRNFVIDNYDWFNIKQLLLEYYENKRN